MGILFSRKLWVTFHFLLYLIIFTLLNRSKVINQVIIFYIFYECFFSFFFKKLISNLYNIILIQIYNFGLNTVVTTFSSSDLKKSLKYFPFFLSMFFFIFLLNTIGIIPY